MNLNCFVGAVAGAVWAKVEYAAGRRIAAARKAANFDFMTSTSRNRKVIMTVDTFAYFRKFSAGKR
jgi:hypothetical protein